MGYHEELLWILDKPGTPLDQLEEKCRINIDFVHALGLKCDCVGWCRMDLNNGRTEEILRAIEDFCRENGWKARCLYTRTDPELESDWYELTPCQLKDATHANRSKAEWGWVHQIKACNESAPKPKHWGDDLFVPDRFRRACKTLGVRELDFCWVRDKGKYAAEQYFQVYGKRLIPHIGVDWGLKKGTPEDIRAAGGWLPRLAEVFETMQQISLPNCYLRRDLPDGGIAHAHIARTNSTLGKNVILIHRDLVRKLLEEKGLTADVLRPAMVVDEVPGGYTLRETEPLPRPDGAFMGALFAEYEKLMATDRPVRQVTEKEALKLLRQAKKERKEEFQKALPKAKAPAVLETAFGPLASYYAVANGGWLSEEFELLSFDRAGSETEAFFRELAAEELLEEKPEGVVIAKCPDGDPVLLLQGGTVVRFSHEAPEVTDQWPTLAQFVAESVQEGM